MSTAPQRARSKLAGLYRGGRGDHDAEVLKARQELRESLVIDAIRKHVDAAPPFTAEQRLRLAAILCNPGGQQCRLTQQNAAPRPEAASRKAGSTSQPP